MATNYSNNSYDIISDKRAIPFNASGTGTIQTIGIGIVGTGTKFLSELPTGSVLVDLSQNEWRKVIRVESDTEAYLQAAFSSDIAALTTPDIIHKSKLSVKQISLLIKDTDPAGELNGSAFSGSISFSKTGQEDTITRSFIDPMIVDATGTYMQVQMIY